MEWKSTQNFLKQALEQSTLDRYESAWRRYREWCKSRGYDAERADGRVVAMYLHHMSEEGLAESTIGGAVSAISDHFRHATVNPTKSGYVTTAKKAVQKKAPPVQRRGPLTRDMLYALADIAATPPSGKEALDVTPVRDFTMILLAFRGMLRSDEVVGLDDDDVIIHRYHAHQPTPNSATGTTAEKKVKRKDKGTWELPRATTPSSVPDALAGQDVLLLAVNSSKTNPQRRKSPKNRVPCTVVVGPDSEPILDPVKWFRRWSALRDRVINASIPLFYNRRRDTDKSMFDRLSPATFNHIIKRRFTEVGYDVVELNLGGHSARAGGATDAAARGADVRLLKLHGRWRSDTVFIYLRDEAGDKLAFNAIVGGLVTATEQAKKPASASST